MTPMDQTTTKETHHFSQSICMHLGKPCPALTRMLTALAGALDKARPVTSAEFELCGDSLLDGCARHCPARFIASHDRIRVFCDVSEAADTATLDLFADTLFQPDSRAFSTTKLHQPPCAMGEALPKPLPQQTTAQTVHPAL
ncbi:hypothetical protein N1037_03615 [Phaeobacter sp. G2]|jgi:hypothetical protein|nr:hypothetical protein N1037_03615 [Phaeobacter sp. G2]